jgi:hypothetical protein
MANTYTKAVLTMTALALVWLCLKDPTPAAQAAAAKVKSPAVIRAQRFELVDEAGRVLGTLGATNGLDLQTGSTVRDLCTLGSLLVAAMAWIVSARAYRAMERNRTSSLLTELAAQATTINDAIARANIPSPYSVRMKLSDLPPNELARVQALQVVFFHHGTLLRMVHRNQHLLSEEDLRGHYTWIRTVYKPWVWSDPYLKALFDETTVTEDMAGHNYWEWLASAMGEDA